MNNNNSSNNNTKTNLSTGASNSAFASFNAIKSSASGSNSYARNAQFYDGQSQFSKNQQSGFTPPQFPRNPPPSAAKSPQNSRNQSKANNSFYHMTDFSVGNPSKPKTDEQIKNKVYYLLSVLPHFIFSYLTLHYITTAKFIKKIFFFF